MTICELRWGGSWNGEKPDRVWRWPYAWQERCGGSGKSVVTGVRGGTFSDGCSREARGWKGQCRSRHSRLLHVWLISGATLIRQKCCARSIWDGAEASETRRALLPRSAHWD